MISSLLLLSILLQEPAPRPAEAGPAEIFELCAKAHLGGKTEVAIEDFKLGFDLVVRDEKNHFQFRASHLFKKPYLVRTTLDDVDYDVKIYTGFDGKTYWLFDKDKGAVALIGKEHEKDIREIEERIRLSLILAKTFSVKRFMEDLTEAKRLADEKTPYGARVVVSAKAKDFVFVKSANILNETPAILYFDPETHLLREIFATPPAPKISPGDSAPNLLERSEKIVLSEHKLVKGVLMPHRIEIFAGKEVKKPAYEITIGEFDFNVGAKDEDFKSPVKK